MEITQLLIALGLIGFGAFIVLFMNQEAAPKKVENKTNAAEEEKKKA